MLPSFIMEMVNTRWTTSYLLEISISQSSLKDVYFKAEFPDFPLL